MSTAKKSRMGSAIAIAICQLLGAVFVAGLFGTVAVLGAALPFIQMASPLLMFAAGTVLSVSLCARGIQTLILADRCRRITKLTGRARRMPLAQLSDALGRPADELLADLGRMIPRGFFADAVVDLDRAELVVGGVPVPPGSQTGERILIQKKRLSSLPMLWFAAAMLTVGAIFPLAELAGLIIALAVGCAVFFISFKTLPSRMVFVETARPVPVVIPAKTGDKSVDELLNSAMEELNALEMYSRKIAIPALSDKVKGLTKTAWEIVEHLKQHPQKSRQARQFIGYYLPTTVKLLAEYTAFMQHTKTDNIKNSMQKIEDMLDTIAQAFRRELDNLYLDKAVDISAEIDVMRGMLQREGFEAADITKP